MNVFVRGVLFERSVYLRGVLFERNRNVYVREILSGRGK